MTTMLVKTNENHENHDRSQCEKSNFSPSIGHRFGQLIIIDYPFYQLLVRPKKNTAHSVMGREEGKSLP